MKKQLLIICLGLIITFSLKAQTNTFPTSGNVGIGTTSPTAKLEINSGDIVLGNENGGNNRRLYLTSSRTSHFITANSWWTEFFSDPNEGWIFKDYNSTSITFNTGGPYIFHDGNLGVGTTNPSGKLDIHGDNSNTTNLVLSANYIDKHRWRFKTIDRGYAIDMDITASSGSDTEEAVLKLSRSNSTRPEFQLYNNAIVVNDGYVGIGTTDTKGFKLGVQGKIAAEEVKVATYSNWADFVFKSNYNLPTLREVEQHIKNKGHLKDIPSAKEVKENGIFLGEMDSKLLQKIEELTLYTIEQQKEIEILKSLLERVTKLEEKIK